MSSRDFKIGAAIIAGGLLAFGLMMVLTRKSFDHVSLITESDGNRQFDHKYFGLIPYSESVKDPSLTVSSDGMKALASSGITNLPDVYAKSPNGWVWRNIRNGKIDYTISIPTRLKQNQVIPF